VINITVFRFAMSAGFAEDGGRPARRAFNWNHDEGPPLTTMHYEFCKLEGLNNAYDSKNPEGSEEHSNH
jgi:hypothetical protein